MTYSAQCQNIGRMKKYADFYLQIQWSIRESSKHRRWKLLWAFDSESEDLSVTSVTFLLVPHRASDLHKLATFTAHHPQYLNQIVSQTRSPSSKFSRILVAAHFSPPNLVWLLLAGSRNALLSASAIYFIPSIMLLLPNSTLPFFWTLEWIPKDESCLPSSSRSSNRHHIDKDAATGLW